MILTAKYNPDTMRITLYKDNKVLIELNTDDVNQLYAVLNPEASALRKDNAMKRKAEQAELDRQFYILINK